MTEVARPSENVFKASTLCLRCGRPDLEHTGSEAKCPDIARPSNPLSLATAMTENSGGGTIPMLKIMFRTTAEMQAAADQVRALRKATAPETSEPLIDWKASYEEALRQRDALTADAERYRFLRNHTWVEAYWIDGAGGVDTKVRVTGCVDHLDLAVDTERIKERPRDALKASAVQTVQRCVHPDGCQRNDACGETCLDRATENGNPQP